MTNPVETYTTVMNQDAREEQYAQFPAHWQPSGIADAFKDTYKYGPGQLPKMNAEVKALWLEALRSGKYLQTPKMLKATSRAIFGNALEEGDPDADKVRYCCLGVLAELAIEAGELDGCKEAANRPGIFQFFAYYQHDDGTKDTESHPQAWETMPGWRVQNWAGLEREIDGYLATANDHGATFGQLADFIEAEL